MPDLQPRLPSDPAPARVAADERSSRANVPNLLSGLRLVGSALLLGLACAGSETLVAPLILTLLLTDWLDGKLAILWQQRTAFGARLDSLADASFYLAILVALAILRSELILAELAWILPPLATYLLSCLAGWFKFRRIPAYHTRAAKTGWLLVVLAVVAIFGWGWRWPLRVVGFWVTLVNVEAILISLVLPESRVDVASLYHAWAARKRFLNRGREPMDLAAH